MKAKKDSLTTMKTTQFALRIFALSILLGGALAQAATVTGTVTNKTTGKPAAGDAVELVDVQAGMRTAAHATTDGSGHYSLSEPGAGPYLIRAMHQGAGYFIAAPQGSGDGKHHGLRRSRQSAGCLHRSRCNGGRGRERPAPGHRALLRPQHQFAARHPVERALL